jgi:carbamate kinase
MRSVVGLGGSALLSRGERPDAATQRWHVREAARALAAVAVDRQLIVCHGNGPQLGTLAVESENDDTLTRPYPLDALGAQTQGLIGYWLAQELRSAGVTRPIAAMVTQAVVDLHDHGAAGRTIYLGPGYTREQVQLWAGELGWRIAQDRSMWRRVVPSAAPVHILELPSISALVDTEALVVCGGGGGVAVAARVGTGNAFEGVDALVDPDATAALLAIELGAEQLLLLTDVAGVFRDFGAGSEQRLRSATTAELARMTIDEMSMAPKVEAACRFVEATGRSAVIGALSDARKVADGRAGTVITAW